MVLSENGTDVCRYYLEPGKNVSDTVITVDKVSKKYIIAHQNVDRNPTIKDAFAGTARSLMRRFRTPLDTSPLNTTKEEFWALSDISFQIEQGDRVGIIGRNGAGKSTLLKILSRITEPTKGRIVLKGRVASLLEVGTGFHPELTGRENIFLNGAVLGMSRSETRRKFDEIVDFAEVEKFLDTPVKRYSSGMYVRLAFAVAAHLEPEILIVDEVLAVGDIAFQKKCLGKMEHVASEGRTVLFVSHNMPSVLSLTRRCILLEKGLVVAIGETERVVGQYLKQFESLLSNSGMAEFTDADRDMSLQGPKGKLTRARLLNENGEQSGTFAEGEPVMLEMGFRILEEVQEVQLGCTVRSKNGQVNLFTTPSPEYQQTLPPGDYSVRVLLSPNHLREGEYILTLKLFADGQRQDHVPDTLGLVIQHDASVVQNRSYFQLWVKGNMKYDYRWGEIQADSKLQQKGAH